MNGLRLSPIRAVCLLGLLALLFQLVTAWSLGQTPATGSQADNRRELTAAITRHLRAGQTASAFAAAQKAVHGGGAHPHEDLQIARLVLSAAVHFKAVSDRAGFDEATKLILDRLALPEQRMQRQDAAQAYALAGQIHEWRGAPREALSAYEHALLLDAGLHRPAERRSYLQNMILIMDGRESANLTLYQRARDAKR